MLVKFYLNKKLFITLLFYFILTDNILVKI